MKEFYLFVSLNVQFLIELAILKICLILNYEELRLVFILHTKLFITFFAQCNLMERQQDLYPVSMKSYQYQTFDILEKLYYSSMAFFAFIFLVNGRLVWRKMPVSRAPELWCM